MTEQQNDNGGLRKHKVLDVIGLGGWSKVIGSCHKREAKISGSMANLDEWSQWNWFNVFVSSGR